MTAFNSSYCQSCKVHVGQSSSEFCPLCGDELTKKECTCLPNLPVNSYPDLSKERALTHLVLRILAFLSLLGGGISLLINWLIPTGVWWSLIVIAASAYLWLSIPPFLRRGFNPTKRILLQVIFTCILIVIVDYTIGFSGWSTSYVVPGILCAGLGGINAMIVFNRTSWAQYVFYQCIMAVFGFTPLLLWLLGLADNRIMVIIAVSMALASLLGTIVFGDRTVKSEFKRRFHV